MKRLKPTSVTVLLLTAVVLVLGFGRDAAQAKTQKGRDLQTVRQQRKGLRITQAQREAAAKKIRAARLKALQQAQEEAAAAAAAEGREQ